MTETNWKTNTLYWVFTSYLIVKLLNYLSTTVKWRGVRSVFPITTWDVLGYVIIFILLVGYWRHKEFN